MNSPIAERPLTAYDRYLPYRRWVEVGYWVVAVVISAIGNTLTVTMEMTRAGLEFHPMEPAIWEWSSNGVILALVPAVVWFTRRFPPHLDTWRRQLPWYALASVVYCLLLIEAYRFLMRRLQGEASLLDAPDDDAPPVEPVERPERFLVRKLGREFLVAAADIESLQAAGNYVNLRVRGRDYPLRSTIAAVEARLDPARFQRVHRSHIVNLDHVAMIEPLDTGDARLHLKDGSTLPCSRRYRAALRERAD